MQHQVSDLIGDSGVPAVAKNACTPRSHVKKVHRKWRAYFRKGKEGKKSKRQEVKKTLQAQSDESSPPHPLRLLATNFVYRGADSCVVGWVHVPRDLIPVWDCLIIIYGQFRNGSSPTGRNGTFSSPDPIGNPKSQRLQDPRHQHTQVGPERLNIAT